MQNDSVRLEPLLAENNTGSDDDEPTDIENRPMAKILGLGDTVRAKSSVFAAENDIEEAGAAENDPLVASFNEDFIDRQADPVEEGGVLCEVCYCEYKENDFFTLKCGHSFCVNCQGDHLKTKISNGQALKLPCMQQGCKEKYSLEQIQMFCSAKIVKTYEVIKADVRVGKSNKLKWCARPGCERTIRRPGCCCKRRAICECGFETCFKCGDAMHEKACQVSGEAGLMMHNINPRVSKCPNCRAPIYKQDGCNHMTCYRCNKEWCWICHMVTPDGYGHFEPEAYFGCFGMTEIPQSIILWILLLTLQIFLSPFVVLGQTSYSIGKKVGCGRVDGDSVIGATFWIGLIFMPLMWIPTLCIWPFVFFYRVYVLLTVIFRHFVFCCCC